MVKINFSHIFWLECDRLDPCTFEPKQNYSSIVTAFFANDNSLNFTTEMHFLC